MSKRWPEVVAWTALIAILVGLPVGVLGYQYVIRPASDGIRVIDIRAAAPEAGGFSPDSITVRAGERVTLRFFSDDVTHGVAIGPGLGVDLGHIDPGRVKEVTVTFDQAGTFTFYCNTWCSPNHWRMRGVIEAVNDTGEIAPPVVDPVIAALIAEGVDIDANLKHDGMAKAESGGEHAGTAHDLSAILLERPPLALRGAALIGSLSVPADLQDSAWRQRHTPTHAVDRLRSLNPAVSDADLADAVAYLWTADSASADLTSAATLYAKNCAACHGASGGADGPASGATAEKPAAFADPAYMFNMRADVLYAKTRRGGMGTDMPNFGTLFTPDETWAVVQYLWRLAFGAVK